VVKLRAQFDNPENILLPGMYIWGILSGGESKDRLLVPQKAVQRDMRGRHLVYVLTIQAPKEASVKELPSSDCRYVETRLVQLDGDYANQWIIREGLRPGEAVMTEGFQTAKPGMMVRILSEQR